jgi:WD40 repeat protein
MSADGRLLAAGMGSRAIRIWDLEAGKELHNLALPLATSLVTALAPDGKTLAFRYEGDTSGIRLVSLATGKELRCFGERHPGNRCDALAFLPDGSALAYLSSSIYLFDSRTGDHFRTLVEPSNGGSWAGMAVSPDGRLVATGYPDRARGNLQPMDTVSLWETASGKLVSQFRGHRWQVCSFAFAHGGRVLVSGSRDGTVRLWDLATGHELRRFDGHRGSVLSLAFSPDDKLLASGGSDTTVLV